jgi:uncharacterized membrane protein
MPGRYAAPRLALTLPPAMALALAQIEGWTVLAALAAGGLVAAALAGRARPLLVAGGAAGAALLLAVVPDALGALPAAGFLLLAWQFGATLRPGAEPLVTRFSRAEYGSIPPAVAAYTRGLTRSWALGLGLLGGLNLLAWGLGAPPAAAALAASLGLVLLAFLAEHPLRLRRFPELGPPSPLRTCRAVWQARHAL